MRKIEVKRNDPGINIRPDHSTIHRPFIIREDHFLTNIYKSQ